MAIVLQVDPNELEGTCRSLGSGFVLMTLAIPAEICISCGMGKQCSTQPAVAVFQQQTQNRQLGFSRSDEKHCMIN
jgi:hypothetical protein